MLHRGSQSSLNVGPIFLESDEVLTVIAVMSYETDQISSGVGYYYRLEVEYSLGLFDNFGEFK
jgi:hypothetical protein